MGFGRRIVSLTGARRALLFDRSHAWKSSSSARGAGLRGNYFVDLHAIDATPARWRDFHTGRRLFEGPDAELGIFPPDALVRLARVGPDGEPGREPTGESSRRRVDGVEAMIRDAPRRFDSRAAECTWCAAP